MLKYAIFICVFKIFCNCIVYIDRRDIDFNPKLLSFSVNFTHNAKGESFTNITIDNYVNITKWVAYASLRLPEDKNDHQYRREIVKTVVNLESCFNGLQSNPLVKGYVDNLSKHMDFKMKLPLRPVSLKSKS